MPQYQRREVQDWLNLFEQQKQSGLTAVAFCRQQQINVQTYYTRRRDIRLQRTSSKFVRKRLAIPPSASQSAMEVVARCSALAC